ncbi:hypothetical protein [Rhizobium subbaraonis]|uniref:hypothetical protein n=1 Tax=Rhizobium subbaraonis TaxID=908946 RepID=UPI000BE28A94|nr:hypothetical protein [Rhizobium subbaraonis]
MLSPDEFTVGTLADAAPLSLILPRTPYEETVLIGRVEQGPAAVFLSGQFAFHFFESSGNTSWKGLIVPNVRIEVDEASLFEPSSGGAILGSVARMDTRLVVRAKRERSFDGGAAVTLHEGLTDAGDFRAGFSRWQIAIGNGQEKRVLWQTPHPAPSGSL